MDENYSSDEIRRSKSASLKDGAFGSFMVGTGEASMSAFAILLGAPAGAVAFISTFPQFIGSIAQLLALPLARRLKKRRWAVAAGFFLQGALWLPMAALALVTLPAGLAFPAALLLITLYFVVGMLINPIWAAWMAELVEPNERGRYFAARNRLAIASLLVSTVLGGLVLLFYDPAHTAAGHLPVLGDAVQALRETVTSMVHLSLLQAFAALFALAFLCRAASAWFVSRMAERHEEGHARRGEPLNVGAVDWMGFLTNPALADERRFDWYTLCLYTATYISAPFFDVYMLSVLHFDYLTWALISIAGPLARYVALPYWGRVADRFGNRSVLFVTGFLVPITPVLWMISPNPVALFFLQMMSGIAWSGFDLATFNYNIGGREASVRTAQTSANNFAKGTGFLAGAILGTAVLALWPAAGWLGLSAFMGLFAISALSRLSASLYFLPRISKQSFEGGMSNNEFFWQVLLVQPGREITQNMLQYSQTGLNMVEVGAGATRRAARKGLDLTIHMLKRGPLLIRTKKDRL